MKRQPKDSEQLQKKRALRLVEIKRLLEAVGKWNVSAEALAAKYHVSARQIYTDITEILQSIDIIDTQDVKFECGRVLKTVTRKAMQGMNDSKLTASERARWATVALQSVEQHTQFITDFGIHEGGDKPKERFSYREFHAAYMAAQQTKLGLKRDPADDDLDANGGK